MNESISLPSDNLNQSKFKLGKYHYEAKPWGIIPENDCRPCAFANDNHKCFNSPPCMAEERDDGQDVYFIEVIEYKF